MFWQIVALLIIVYLLYHTFIKDPRFDKSIPILPYNFPYFGHIPSINWNKEESLKWFTGEMRKAGGRLFISIPHPASTFLVISDPKDIKHLINDNFKNYTYTNSRKLMGKEVFGHGIFQVDGDLWSMQRNMAKPIFTKNSLKLMTEITQRDTEKLLLILNNSHKSGESINIMEAFKKLTIDAFVELAFGIEFNSQLKDVEFCDDFDWIQEAIENKIVNPLWTWQFSKKYEETVKRVEDFVYKMIDVRRKEDFSSKNDFLSILIASQKVEGNNYTDKLIRDILLNFLIAGRDTTACLLTWCIYFLSTHPDVENKVLEEIENTLGKEGPNFDNIDSLKYMKTVMDETLRIYPPAISMSGKAALQDDVFPSGFKVPAGAEINYSAYATHRLPEYWGDDCEEFKPSRWEKPLKHPYQFIPFQRGPRICMGMDMAYMEAKIVLTSILQSGLRLKVEKGQDLRLKTYFPIILNPRNGLVVKVNKV